jgi:hypothetical protein
MGTLLGSGRIQFDKKANSNATLEKAWKVIAPNADIEQFKERGGWTQGVEELLLQFPAWHVRSDPIARTLAEQLARLFDGVSAADLLLP